jgi:ATP-dependent RNA helicase DBP3
MESKGKKNNKILTKHQKQQDEDIEVEPTEALEVPKSNKNKNHRNGNLKKTKQVQKPSKEEEEVEEPKDKKKSFKKPQAPPKEESEDSEEEEEEEEEEEVTKTKAQKTPANKQKPEPQGKAAAKKRKNEGENESQNDTVQQKKQKGSGNTSTFTNEEVLQYRESNFISVIGEPELIRPYRSFEETKFPPDLLSFCKTFEKPTPIQAQCWPIIGTGRDVVGISQTGSGKTIAFLFPGIVRMRAEKLTGKGPYILILAPTRELAMQTASVCQEFQKSGISSCCVYGGAEKGPQKKQLAAGAQIVIATPGRLIDLLEEKALTLSKVDYLVLDEADRMLDMGFEPAIRSIISRLKTERQTLMFSATWPQEIQKLASEFQNDPIRINIGQTTELTSNRSVKQAVEVVEDYEKDKKLQDLLYKFTAKNKHTKIIVFALYKKEAQRVEDNLKHKGWNVVGIHGDLPQYKRTAALQGFRDGKQTILVATDVAARGLDIPDVEYVINYTFPLTVEDYVHRIGRTGRAGREGVSYTFFTKHDRIRSGEFINLLKDSGQEVPEELYKFGTATKKKEHALYGAHFKVIENPAIKTHVKFDD